MTITAKYAATCPACNRPIRAGDKIEWQRGTKARHTSCAGSATQTSRRVLVAKRKRGTWTGCSCGSVEEYERDSDCSSCQHDR
jgi:hypothetical protein